MATVFLPEESFQTEEPGRIYSPQRLKENGHDSARMQGCFVLNRHW